MHIFDRRQSVGGAEVYQPINSTKLSQYDIIGQNFTANLESNYG